MKPKFARNLELHAHDSLAPTSQEPPTVLLVDDNEATLARASVVLSAGCVVVGTVSDGYAALDAAAALNPEVVVLDISMPGMHGFELAKRLRAAGSTAQLVFLTMHDEEEFFTAAQDVGAMGYVVKTHLMCDLVMAVREARAGRTFRSPAR
jgi:DNA-binding NarL/FixJ family response regulator